MTCWRDFVALVQKQVEAPSKQDHFQYRPASKTMTAHCHTRCRKHHMLEGKTNIVISNIQVYKHSPPAPPSPSLNGQVPKYECWLQDTRPFHFCLDESALLCNWFFSFWFFFLFFFSRSKSNCMNNNKVQWRICATVFGGGFSSNEHTTGSYTCIIHFKQRNAWKGWESHQIASY